MHVTWTAPRAAVPPATEREQLARSIEHWQSLVDTWQPEVETGLAQCDRWRTSSQRNDKIAAWGLKAAAAGGAAALIGLGVSTALGSGGVGAFPGLAVFVAGITTCQIACMKRDDARLELSMQYPSLTHKQRLLQNDLVPRLAAARAALREADSAEARQLIEGLGRSASVLERDGSVWLGGTRIKKR